MSKESLRGQPNPADYSGLQVYDPEPPEKQVSDRDGTEEKQALGTSLSHEGKEPYITKKHGAVYTGNDYNVDESRSKVRRRKILWAIVALVLVMVIVVAVAVPVALHSNKSSSKPAPVSNSTSSPAPDAVNQSGLSTTGAWNGTSIANLNTDNNNDMMLFYQHYTGEIRSVLNTGSQWQANDVVVSDNVKNGTSIAATSYNEGANNTYHLIYLDQSNILQDLKQVNASGKWVPGSLGTFNFKASDASRPGLSICSSPSWPHGPGPSYTTIGSDGGKRVYYGGEDNLIHEVSLGFQSDEWAETHTFPSSLNGNAGIVSQVPNGNTYVMASTLEGSLVVWMIDRSTAANTTTHTNGAWSQGPDAAITLSANSSLGTEWSTNVWFQDPKNNIVGIVGNETVPTAEFWQSSSQVGTSSALPGTSISGHIDHTGPTAVLNVFFQPNGSSIVEYLRDGSGGEWTMTEIPVD